LDLAVILSIRGAVTKPEWVQKRRLLRAKLGNGPTITDETIQRAQQLSLDRYANTA
jgi:hypothetical protein